MSEGLDQHWSEYYAEGKDFRLITSQALTKILEDVDTTLQKTCLDIGCGTGQLTRELFHRGYQCTGIDSSSKAVELARRNTNAPELTYRMLNIEKDDVQALSDTPYSLITLKLALAFIDDKSRLLTTVKRLLIPGGSLAIITPVHRDAAEATPISVDYSDTLRTIAAHFDTLVDFEHEGLHYFIAR